MKVSLDLLVMEPARVLIWICTALPTLRSDEDAPPLFTILEPQMYTGLLGSLEILDTP